MPSPVRAVDNFSGEDETLECCDCKQPFVFTAGEQDFYQSKGFDHKPRRCKECREIHKQKKNNGGNRSR